MQKLIRFISFLYFFSSLELVSAQKLTPQQWQSDFDYLKKEIGKRCPSFYDQYPEKDFDRDLQNLSASVNNRSFFENALMLQTILAKGKDTYVRLDLSQQMMNEKIIPIGIGSYAEGLCISATVKKFEKSLRTKVVNINGFTPEEVIEKLSPYCSADNAQTIRRDVTQWLRFPAAFRQAGISKTDTLDITLLVGKGGKEVHRFYPIDPKKNPKDMIPSILSPREPDLRYRTDLILWDLQHLAKDSVVYFQYNACVSNEMLNARGATDLAPNYPLFKPTADSIITLLRKYPNARFFFDLRQNNGGFTDDGYALADAIAAIPEINIKGRLFVAIGWMTAVESVNIAKYFRDKTEALLVGEPTAERPGREGQPVTFGLPNTGLTVTTPSRPVRFDKDAPRTLEPNFLILRPYASFLKGSDPVLDFVRQGAKVPEVKN